MLQSCGANVIVAMTVTRANCADIAAMVAKYGSHLTVQPLFKAGRASMADDLALIGVEYYRALAAVEGVAPMGAVSAKLKSLRGRGVRRCAMTEREISIAETGDMYPCQLLHEERFRGGRCGSDRWQRFIPIPLCLRECSKSAWMLWRNAQHAQCDIYAAERAEVEICSRWGRRSLSESFAPMNVRRRSGGLLNPL